MKHIIRTQSEAGFSLMELLVAILILLPIMGAAMSLFSVGAHQQTSEQSSIDVNQGARAGMEMMEREIAQAGSHRDASTTTTESVTGNASAVTEVHVNSTVGFNVGDWIDIDNNNDWESVQLTQVTGNSITGVFKRGHNPQVPVSLLAYPYQNGVIPPSGLGAYSSATATLIRFYGDINGDISSPSSDPNIQYVEYSYDSTNRQITRSITPITQSTKAGALPLINNVDSAAFTVNTNGMGIITSVDIAMTVRSTFEETGSKFQQTQLSSRVFVPSAAAASVLLYELQQFQDFNRLPGTPNRIASYLSQ